MKEGFLFKICRSLTMIETLIVIALIVFLGILFKKPKHRRTKGFIPRPISRSFSRNPNNKKK